MKRARDYAPSYARKRTKTVRRYRKRRSTRVRKNAFVTSQRGGSTTLYMSRRKPMMSARAYRNNLWKSTEQKEHFRSYATFTNSITTPASATTKAVSLATMYDEQFYTTAGGATNNNTYAGDIIIRGGLCTLHMTNGQAVTLKVEVYKLYIKDLVPIFTTPIGLAWDPTNFADFQQYFTIAERRTFDIEPGDTATMMHKLRVRKVDQSISAAVTRQPAWLICVNNPSATAVSLATTLSHNMSFSADVVT